MAVHDKYDVFIYGTGNIITLIIIFQMNIIEFNRRTPNVIFSQQINTKYAYTENSISKGNKPLKLTPPLHPSPTGFPPGMPNSAWLNSF